MGRHRYGLETVIEVGAAPAGPVSPASVRLLGRAIALFEAHTVQRPAGWPASGPAALCLLGRQRRADRLAGDIARLWRLAKAMRAAALENDAAHLDRARVRAHRRATPSPTRFQFRIRPPRWETGEQRRCRVRDVVLLEGGNPAAWPNAELARGRRRPGCATEPALLGGDRFEELDGTGARAVRYRAELARGDWRLPPPLALLSDQPPDPKEPSR